MEIDTELDIPRKEDSSDDDLFKCSYCDKNIKNFFKFAPLYCPYCGGPLNDDILPGGKRSNVLTGKAIWGKKWALLGPLIGFFVMLTASFVVEFIMIFAIIMAAGTFDLDAILDMTIDILESPVILALLSIVEVVFIFTAILTLRKYKKTPKERMLLLGWRPYFKTKYQSSNQSKIPRLVRDICLGIALAIAMVFAQFGVSMVNDLIWYPLTGGIQVPSAFMARSFLDMIVLAVSMIAIVGPTEEFLFRGLSQQGLEADLGQNKALIISTVLFMVVHVGPVALADPLSGAYLAFPYFIISSMLCYIYTRTKNLNLMIFVHGFYDAILVVFDYLFYKVSNNLFTLTVLISFIVIIAIFSAGWITLELGLHYHGELNLVRTN